MLYLPGCVLYLPGSVLYRQVACSTSQVEYKTSQVEYKTSRLSAQPPRLSTQPQWFNAPDLRQNSRKSPYLLPQTRKAALRRIKHCFLAVCRCRTSTNAIASRCRGDDSSCACGKRPSRRGPCSNVQMRTCLASPLELEERPPLTTVALLHELHEYIRGMSSSDQGRKEFITGNSTRQQKNPALPHQSGILFRRSLQRVFMLVIGWISAQPLLLSMT